MRCRTFAAALSHGRRHVVPPSRRGDIGGFHGEEPASEEPAVSVMSHARRASRRAVVIIDLQKRAPHSMHLESDYAESDDPPHTTCNRSLTIGLMS